MRGRPAYKLPERALSPPVFERNKNAPFEHIEGARGGGGRDVTAHATDPSQPALEATPGRPTIIARIERMQRR
ncbi:hypothetical protein EVAR_63721_1 [Eumeta japonica]|uniref:Uncharacterized protein n=1 Tax=Eumeta variegata TaxID=151549 RepID=A0A4C1ZX28_EUMVA|nr:hypothetical protein EVAR_63721_1 [Eumeta japonica]